MTLIQGTAKISMGNQIQMKKVPTITSGIPISEKGKNIKICVEQQNTGANG